MKRFLLCAVVVALFLVLVCISWWIYGNQSPVFKTREAAMPKPNARDYYVKAGAKAHQVLLRSSLGPAVEELLSGGPEYPLSAKRSILNDSAAALRTLRRGLPYRYMAPPPKGETGDPSLALFHDLAKLLALDQQLRAASGDWSGAVSCSLDGIKFGQDLANGSAMVGLLLSVSCQSIARHGVWPRLGHLSGEESRSAAHRLERLLDEGGSLADTVRCEKAWSLRSLARDMDKPDWPNVLAKKVIDEEAWSGFFGQFIGAKMPEKPPPQPALARQIRMYGKRYLFAGEANYQDRSIAVSEQPYAAKAKPPDLPTDPLHKYQLDLYASLRFDYTKNFTANRLLLVGIALQAYRAEHGAYPQTLKQLAPAYLTKLPDDPFALNQGFRYRRWGGKYVLYSLGPDCKDDDGQPAMSTLGIAGRAANSVQLNSVGDFVAGVSF